MDVESAIMLAGVAAAGAASEAGRTAWESLVALTRRLTGRTATAEPAEPAEPAGDPAALVDEVAARARADADFAAELCRWASEHRAALQLTQDQSTQQNIIGGNASISGTVIQARDIQGDITL